MDSPWERLRDGGAAERQARSSTVEREADRERHAVRATHSSHQKEHDPKAWFQVMNI